MWSFYHTHVLSQRFVICSRAQYSVVPYRWGGGQLQFFWLFPWGDSYLLPPYYVIFKILFDYLKFCLKFYMTILIKSIKTSILWVSDCNQFKYYHLSIKYSCYRLQIPMNFHKFNKVPTLENLNPPPRYSGPPPVTRFLKDGLGTVIMPPVYSVLQSNELNKTAALIRYRLFILSPSNDTTAESKRSTLL
jgi:hypothetical protein